MALGLVVNGLTTYAFFGVAYRVLDDASASALSALWALLFGLGNGAMQPLEQEVARAVSARRARGEGAGPVIRRAMVIGGGFTLVLSCVIIASSQVVRIRLLGGSGSLVVALVIGLFGFAVGHLTRGSLSSHGRFGAYAVFFGGEGTYRFLAAVVLALVGTKVIGPWGLALGLSPMLAAGTALVRQRGMLADGPVAAWSELTSNLGWLLLGAGSLSLLLQSGTLAIQWLSSGVDDAAAGTFLKGLLVARVPLFLFQAVLASLLPKLTRLATERKYDEFRDGLRSLVLLILAGGAIAAVGAGLLGPWVAARMFGSGAVLGGRDLALLAVSHILIMAAICLDQALIALDGHSRMALGWVAALVTFAVATIAGTDLFFRVELGLVMAGVVALLWMYGFLDERLRHHAGGHDLSLADTIADLSV